MARIPVSIRTPYVSVFEWPNCDGDEPDHERGHVDDPVANGAAAWPR